LDKIKSKPDLTQQLADQELWQKRFKKWQIKNTKSL
jgi:hypothetical protein